LRPSATTTTWPALVRRCVEELDPLPALADVTPAQAEAVARDYLATGGHLVDAREFVCDWLASCLLYDDESRVTAL
jgi:hypothetical protein